MNNFISNDALFEEHFTDVDNIRKVRLIGSKDVVLKIVTSDQYKLYEEYLEKIRDCEPLEEKI